MCIGGGCQQHTAHKCMFNHLWDFDNPLKAMAALECNAKKCLNFCALLLTGAKCTKRGSLNMSEFTLHLMYSGRQGKTNDIDLS